MDRVPKPLAQEKLRNGGLIRQEFSCKNCVMKEGGLKNKVEQESGIFDYQNLTVQ